jgi:hypothetical protein
MFLGGMEFRREKMLPLHLILHYAIIITKY